MNQLRRYLRTAALLVGLLPFATLANETTVLKLLSTGRIVLGANDTVMPLSYTDTNGQHIGYHLDVCARIIASIRQRYDLPMLKVVTVPTNLATRIALLNNNTVDIDCGHNAIKPSTLSQALLTHATMISEVHLMAMSERSLTMATLDGLSVGLAAGDSAAAALRGLARKNKFSIKEVFTRSLTDSFAQLESGRIDVMASATPYLLAQRALSANPSRYSVMDEVLLREPIAVMFRLQDEELHALANETLAAMMKSGELVRLYEKWFMQTIPGLNEPIGMPMPAALRALFKTPGSELMDL